MPEQVQIVLDENEGAREVEVEVDEDSSEAALAYVTRQLNKSHTYVMIGDKTVNTMKVSTVRTPINLLTEGGEEVQQE